MKHSRTTLGSSLAINLPDAQAKCYITVQKDGIAFAALADDQYPERVAFMILKKVSQEFAIKYEAGQFAKIESILLLTKRMRT
jgi:synaptobrevin family protein YKT6